MLTSCYCWANDLTTEYSSISSIKGGNTLTQYSQTLRHAALLPHLHTATFLHIWTTLFGQISKLYELYSPWSEYRPCDRTIL